MLDKMRGKIYGKQQKDTEGGTEVLMEEMIDAVEAATQRSAGQEEGEAPVTQPGKTEGPDLFDRWSELVSAVLLGLVAIATAWSGYQSARWGGTMSIKFSQAGAMRTESTRAQTSAGQLVLLDVAMYLNWISAYGDGNQELADFYAERFRPVTKKAVDDWLAMDPMNNPDAPASPFASTEYRETMMAESDRLEEEAAALFQEGTEANQQSDDYILNAVILASVLFLGGIAPRFTWRPIRLGILAVAVALLALGLYNLIIYPVA